MRWNERRRDCRIPPWLEVNDGIEPTIERIRSGSIKLYRRDQREHHCLVAERMSIGDVWEWFENCYTFEQDKWLESCLNLYIVPSDGDIYFRINVFTDGYSSYAKYQELLKEHAMHSFAQITWFPKIKKK